MIKHDPKLPEDDVVYLVYLFYAKKKSGVRLLIVIAIFFCRISGSMLVEIIAGFDNAIGRELTPDILADDNAAIV